MFFDSGIPIITQSDQGTENNGVANVQTLIRHRLDPSLEGTLQHRFATDHNNILSEIKWSIFRRDFSPGFEDILESGVHNGWYDINDIIEKYVAGLRWVIQCRSPHPGTSSNGSPYPGYRPRSTLGFDSRTEQRLVLSGAKFSRMASQP
jgi:hypothetical protein